MQCCYFAMMMMHKLASGLQRPALPPSAVLHDLPHTVMLDCLEHILHHRSSKTSAIMLYKFATNINIKRLIFTCFRLYTAPLNISTPTSLQACIHTVSQTHLHVNVQKMLATTRTIDSPTALVTGCKPVPTLLTFSHKHKHAQPHIPMRLCIR